MRVKKKVAHDWYLPMDEINLSACIISLTADTNRIFPHQRNCLFRLLRSWSKIEMKPLNCLVNGHIIKQFHWNIYHIMISLRLLMFSLGNFREFNKPTFNKKLILKWCTFFTLLFFSHWKLAHMRSNLHIKLVTDLSCNITLKNRINSFSIFVYKFTEFF